MKLKYIALTLVAALTLTFASCSEAENTAVSETTAAETTAKYTDEELDVLAENMPEIVFVLSHHYDDTNILGYYVTNTGEIKLYDFRQIAPNEIYEIPDVYDRLEEAGCSKIEPHPSLYFDETTYQELLIAEEKFTDISEKILIRDYKSLLLTDKDSEYVEYESIADMVQGYYDIYGIRYNENNEREIILLGSEGDYIFRRDDEYAKELVIWIKLGEPFSNLSCYDDVK